MGKYIDNPFIINGYEGPDYFCDREHESAQLIRELKNGNNVALIATRRIGKSGLIKHCFNNRNLMDGYYTFYIDIYATRSLEELVFRLSKEIVGRLKPLGIKVLETFWNCVKSLQPGITFSPNGEVKYSLRIGDITHAQESMDEIFHYFGIADKPCVVAIDEFQQIDRYSDKNVEALLRTYVQQYPQVRFIFAGSQRHLMTQMFCSAARPFYQSVSMMHIGAIDMAKYESFARQHFENAGKHLGDGVVEYVFLLSKSITWYVQKIMNTLFYMTQVDDICDKEMVDAALAYILSTLDFGFRELMFRIPEKQGRLLIALAKSGASTAITSSAFIKKNNLSSSSMVQSAARGLLEKDYITQEMGQYSVYDLFLEYWIKMEY